MAMSADTVLTLRDEMESLLPFYLNGTLQGPDLVRLEHWLATDPHGAVALAAAEDELSAAMAANEAIRPRPDALSRFSAALEREAPNRAAGGLLASLFGRLRTAPPALAWAAAAAMLAVIVVQTAVVNRGGEGYEVAGQGDNQSEKPFALVAFKADATAEAIATILTQAGGSIIDGPKPGGFFRVAIATDSAEVYDAALAVLDASGVVDTIMPGLRPQE